MPYKVKKSGSGYKVFKKGTSKSFSKKPLTKAKARTQQKALYANESLEDQLDRKEVYKQNLLRQDEKSDTLEYFKLWRYPKSNEYQAWFKLGSGKDILFTIVYKYTGETLEDVDYVETRVTDPGIPAIQIFEDPQSEEASKILSQYGITGDDIENAGQEGYEAIERYRPKKETLEDSLQFEKYAVSILKSEKES